LQLDLEKKTPGDQPYRREAVRLSNVGALRPASLSEFPPPQWTLPDANYLALVKLAASRIWMRFMSR